MTTTIETGARPGAGSPYHRGWLIVAGKELTDHVRSLRFLILLALMSLAGLAAVHSASGPIRDTADAASQTPSVFLYLFTLAPERVPAFLELIAILGPLLGIAFGFDAISGERAQGTLPRLVAQPIHRDEIINGKFAAGIGAIAVALLGVVAIVGGYGTLRLGIGPSLGDLVRLMAFLILTVAYISIWLALATALSVVTRRASTAALGALAVWLVLALFAGLIAGMVADAVHGVDASSTQEQLLANARTELAVRHLSPDQLYRDAAGVLLNPSRQTTGILVVDPTSAALPSNLPLIDSLLLAWWQVTALVAGAVGLFVATYLAFLRQEVRA